MAKKDVMKEMRDRYQRAVDADSENRKQSRDDIKFVSVQGNQWDETQRKARKGRPCYEFPILRSHWRQVCNDQKQARPSIKVSGVEDDDKDGADLRQGMIRNIERMSNASKAYDVAFEEMTAGGFGAWRLTTKYIGDDAFDQDIAIEPINDAVNRVWLDPDAKCDDSEDAMWGFVEDTISLDEFTARYPKAQTSSFDSQGTTDWFTKDSIRIVEYWRCEKVKKRLIQLSDGRVLDEEQFAQVGDELMFSGVQVERERMVDGKKVTVSICSGAEELEKAVESVFNRIPIITIYGNRAMIDGKWQYTGMVRWSRDPQKLLNYNLTTAQEIISKQPKSPYLVTPKMLEGDGIKAMWDKANAIDAPYLAYNHDPLAGAPVKLPPPDMPAALTAMAQMSVDMLKASDGIFDASVGARSNETSGKAIIARQREGDTATFDYQDSLNNGIRATGITIVDAMPKIYDTPRSVRILGRDGGEKYVKLYQSVRDEDTGEMVTVNDLSSGKYDVAVSSGASYSTQRAEFVDMMMSLSQSNPAILQVAGDLIMGAMDFPKSEEVAERLKALLPPQIQQSMQKDQKQSPEVMQMQAQFAQAQEQAQMQMQEMQQAYQECAQENEQLKTANANKQGELQIKAQSEQIDAAFKAKQIELDERALALKEFEAQAKAENDRMALQLKARELEMKDDDATFKAGLAVHQANNDAIKQEVSDADSD